MYAKADISSWAMIAALYGTLMTPKIEDKTENWYTQKAAVSLPSGICN